MNILYLVLHKSTVSRKFMECIRWSLPPPDLRTFVFQTYLKIGLVSALMFKIYFKIKNHTLWANSLILIKFISWYWIFVCQVLLLLFCIFKDLRISIYFQGKETEHSPTNLLGLDTVDDGVHQRWEKDVDVAISTWTTGERCLPKRCIIVRLMTGM